MQGLVYKEFNRDRHVFDELPKRSWVEDIVGIDFGFTHPCAVLKAKKDFDGHYWFTDEWVKTGKTDAQIAEAAAEFSANKYYPDPENPGGIKELSNRGLYVVEVVKGKGSVRMGVDQVRQLFMQGRIHIHKSLVHLIAGIEMYHYADTLANKKHAENPEKEDDDECDAMRYMLVGNDTAQDQRHRQMQSQMLRNRIKNTVNYAE